MDSGRLLCWLMAATKHGVMEVVSTKFADQKRHTAKEGAFVGRGAAIGWMRFSDGRVVVAAGVSATQPASGQGHRGRVPGRPRAGQ